ncbi:hypothetical protein JCM8547_002895 [Rhodosporidiobolus lusitaniae]
MEQREDVPDSIEEAAAQWQALAQDQHDFVHWLVDEQRRLRRQIAALAVQVAQRQEQAQEQQEQQQQDREDAELHRGELAELEREFAREENELQAVLSDVQARAEQLSLERANIETQRLDLEERKEAEEAVTAVEGNRMERTWEGKAQAVVLVNGNIAPFADELIQLGYEGGRAASTMLKESFTVHIRAESPLYAAPEISLYSVQVRAAVANLLVERRVISAKSTVDAFLHGLRINVPGLSNTISDLPIPLRLPNPSHDTPINAHLLELLISLCFNPAVRKIYLAGVHPEALLQLSRMQDMRGPGAVKDMEEKIRVLLEKVVFINHTLDPALAGASGPTLELPHLFNSSSARPAAVGPARGVYGGGGGGEGGRNGDGRYEGNGGGGGNGGNGAGGGAYKALPAAGGTGGGGREGYGSGKGKERAVDGNGGSKKSRSVPPSLLSLPTNGRFAIKELGEPVKKGRKINAQKGMLQQDLPICFFHYLTQRGCTNIVKGNVCKYDVMTSG